MESAAAADTWRASERDLLTLHRQGDPAAFDAIYAEHERLVFNLALRLSGDAEQAADLTQEAFLRVYRGLDRFRGRSSLKTWIYRVALNCCRSRLRRAAGPAAQPVALERAPEPTDPSRGPEERAAAREVEAAVQAALARVPMPYREAVVLRDLHGLSYAEIGSLLGIRGGTVRSRIARGRERLRQLLEGDA